MADRESCIVALNQVLDGIEGIKEVSREFKAITQVKANKFPTVIIEDDGKEEIFNKTGDFSDIRFTISIIGYVNKGKDTGTHVNALDKLVKKTLGVDFLSSTGIMMTAGISMFRVRELVDRSSSAIAPYGFFEREIDLTYESRLSLGL